MPQGPLTPDEIKKLLGMTRSRSVPSKQSRELLLKRRLEKQLGQPLTDSQVQYIIKRMPELMEEVPTRPEPELGATHITAQRLFFIRPRLNLLESYAKSELWYPGEIKEAKCVQPYGRRLKHPEEQSPVLDCSCGIWVCNSRVALTKAFPRVWPNRLRKLVVSAQVDAWGKCIEHEWGWRVQYARIKPETIQIYPRVNGRRVSRERFIGHLRRKYGYVAMP